MISGFIMLIIGILAIILSLVSVSFTFLRPIEKLGFFWAFTIKGILCLVGFIMVYMATQKGNITK